MNIADQILNFLRQKYNSGMTQQEMARDLNTSQQHIQRLLSGQQDVSGMAVRSVIKMFPNATLNLNGDSVSISAESNSGTVVGINTGTIGADCLSAISDKILMDEDLTNEEKIKFLKFLKK